MDNMPKPKVQRNINQAYLEDLPKVVRHHLVHLGLRLSIVIIITIVAIVIIIYIFPMHLLIPAHLILSHWATHKLLYQVNLGAHLETHNMEVVEVEVVVAVALVATALVQAIVALAIKYQVVDR